MIDSTYLGLLREIFWLKLTSRYNFTENKIDSDEKGNVWFKDEEDNKDKFKGNDEDIDTLEEDSPTFRLLDKL